MRCQRIIVLGILIFEELVPSKETESELFIGKTVRCQPHHKLAEIQGIVNPKFLSSRTYHQYIAGRKL